MIIKETFYGVECDACGKLFEGYEYSFWSDENYALENATDSEWIKDDKKHYCPDCYSYDDNDNLIIKTKEEKK
jgi:hypothetical protein